MKKSQQIITLLVTIEEGADIYDLEEAKWIRKFKSVRPECVTLTFNQTKREGQPYFHAILTPRGKQHLSTLRSENAILGLR